MLFPALNFTKRQWCAVLIMMLDETAPNSITMVIKTNLKNECLSKNRLNCAMSIINKTFKCTVSNLNTCISIALTTVNSVSNITLSPGQSLLLRCTVKQEMDSLEWQKDLIKMNTECPSRDKKGVI